MADVISLKLIHREQGWRLLEGQAGAGTHSQVGCAPQGLRHGKMRGKGAWAAGERSRPTRMGHGPPGGGEAAAGGQGSVRGAGAAAGGRAAPLSPRRPPRGGPCALPLVQMCCSPTLSHSGGFDQNNVQTKVPKETFWQKSSQSTAWTF